MMIETDMLRWFTWPWIISLFDFPGSLLVSRPLTRTQHLTAGTRTVMYTGMYLP